MAEEGIRYKMSKTSKKVVVTGTGYVGLPLAIMLARVNYKVIGVDIDKNVVRAINNGELHIKEKNLDKILKEPDVRKNLIAQEDPCEGDIFVIAVPTPLHKRKKNADLTYVEDALFSILPFLKKGNLIIIESTIPPLTCKEFIAPLIEINTKMKVGKDIYLAHCPERILPGDIFQEIVNNDRIIGGVNEKSRDLAAEMYSSFVKGKLYKTDDVIAETCKLMENTYRDVNIALANELSLVSDILGINVNAAINFANKHPRVNLLRPGIGVGGHCIPIDPWFITEVDPANTFLISSARRVNDRMPTLIARRVRVKLKDIKSPKIVAVGLAYKPNTHDFRESPAIKVIKILKEEGYDIEDYDPLIDGKEYTTLSDIATDKDCLIVFVEHDEIMKDLKENKNVILEKLKHKLIIRF